MHILLSYHHHKFNLFISSTHFSGKNVNHSKLDVLLHVSNIRGSTKIALICKPTRERGKQRERKKEKRETDRNRESETEKHKER
jgi:hypothetical protein